MARALDDKDPAQGRLSTRGRGLQGPGDPRPFGEAFTPACQWPTRPREGIQRVRATPRCRRFRHRPRPHRRRLAVDAGTDAREAGPTLHTVMRLMEQFPDTISARASRSSTTMRARTIPTSSPISRRGRPKNGGNRSVACGWRPTAILPGLRLWRASSCWTLFLSPALRPHRRFAVLWLPTVWLCVEPAAVDPRGRTRLLFHHQDRREPVQPPALRLLLVAGSGRHAVVQTHFSTTPDPGAFASTYNAKATAEQNLGRGRIFSKRNCRIPCSWHFW